MPGVVVDLGRAGAVAEHEGVRGGAVEETERDAGVRRVHERALAFDEQELATALDAFDDQPLCSTGNEVGNDRVDGDPPSRDRHAGLPGGHEHGAQPTGPRLAVELERDGHLPDRAVRADREHDPRRVPPGSPRWARSALPAGGAGRAARLRSARPARRARDRRRGTRAGRSPRAAPGRIQARTSSRHAGGKRPPAGATPDDRGRRPEAQRPVDVGHDRHAVLGLPRARRVQDRDDVARVGSAGRRASSSPSAGRPRRLPRGAAAASQSSSSTPSPGSSDGV